jgi:hypothetical protein
MSENDAKDAKEAQNNEYSKGRSSRFRFKSKREARDGRDDRDSGSDRRRKRRRDGSPSEPTRFRRHRHRRERKRSRSPVKDDPSTYDDTYLPNSRSSQYVDPDTAFRESLFDALADDEGASYWEGVYGQPIHMYPKTKEGPQGELEQMDDEEYATYVRNRMWEKSHQHIIEERERRDEQRHKDKLRAEQDRHARPEASHFDSLIDAALQRGERRKKRKSWEQAWKEYTVKWTQLIELSKEGEAGTSTAEKATSSLIPWPVESGEQEDISKDNVRAFFQKHPPEDLSRLLKVERVQWHPDKMQQRLRGRALDDKSAKSVTAVFQIVDDLWAETKKK